MKILSLFDGISCGQVALKRANIDYTKYFASEIKEDSILVTMDNFPNTKQIGDVKSITQKDIEKIKPDLIIGGSPCQDLSVAMANREGIKGSKSELFFEYLRILRLAQVINPNVLFLLENVGSMRIKDREIITELLGVEPVKINSKLLSPQLRNRYYWTNIDIPRSESIKEKEILLQDVLMDGWTDRTKARCILESESRPLTTPVKMFHRYYSTGFTTLIFKSKKHFEMCKEHYDYYFKEKSAYEIDDYIDEYKPNLSVYDGLRYLNQEELERCQTLPCGYTEILDRNSAASVIGDGWTVDVIAWIFSFIN